MADSAPESSIAPRDGEISPEGQYPYQRRFNRRKVRLKLDVQAAQSYHAWTVNLSPDGVCFEIPDELDKGREITIWIFLEQGDSENPVQARCRVLWINETNKGTMHGGQFLFFADNGLARLKRWMTKDSD